MNQNEIDYTADDWVDEAIGRLARDLMVRYNPTASSPYRLTRGQGFVDVAYGPDANQRVRFRIDRYHDDVDAPVGLVQHRLPYHGGYVCFVEVSL